MTRYAQNEKVNVKLTPTSQILTAVILLVAVNGYIIEFQCHNERHLDFITDKQIIPA